MFIHRVSIAPLTLSSINVSSPTSEKDADQKYSATELLFSLLPLNIFFPVPHSTGDSPGMMTVEEVA